MSSPTATYVQLGRSGLRISVPILGAMSYGNPNWGATDESTKWVLGDEQALPILKAAWDRGVNTIDTANMYSNGDSERVVAKFIEKYQIPREEIIIATKCWGLVGKGPDHDVMTWAQFPTINERKEYINQSGLSRAAIFHAVEGSLARLNTSYIDLLQIHRFDFNTPPEETMKALHDLVESGKVRYIGASSMRAWQFALLNEVAEKHNWTKFVSMQNEYSLLYREEEREMLAYCKYHGIGVIPWSPLAGGLLARPRDSDSANTPRAKLFSSLGLSKADEVDAEIIKRVEEVAKKRGWTMSQVALAWAQRAVTSPIVGFNSVKRVDQAIVDGELTDEEAKYLEEPYQPKPVRGHA
ncbi:Aldo/keto reductase [Schizophyllum commune H4-8]|uniref:NADP-dependent oxidoreductase domain-containing protein n=1 Tax=Schizophyllum commune (strain H4-8 / FGSC 9210) TaxID=578458 RepID=D8Q4R9_SCHCM|nr:Aldo/keto reductase [Schizophyllum commune H4-8]KAI5892497.1 Aldo/keto reductase [Schizophyllum commune H4-8]